MKTNMLLIILILMVSQVWAGGGRIHGDGVLINSSKSKEKAFYGLDFREGVEILNTKDRSVYGRLFTDMESYEFYFIKNGVKLTPQVRGFDPISHVFILDAKIIREDQYEVHVDGDWKTLRGKSGLTYKSWNEFLQEDASFIALKGKSLVMYKNKDDAHGTVIDSTEHYAFEIKEVEGDRVFAACHADCEGCGSEKKPIEGWFKWKNEQELLVDLRFAC